MAMTGDDIEDAFSIIESNGGAGEYETGEATEQERWNFPRFKGADAFGSCGKHEGMHEHIEKGKGKCENFAPDPGNMYLSRPGIGDYDTDVETVVAWLEAPRNVVGATLLLGEPGTGKTALIEAAVTHMEREMTSVLCTPDHTKDSLFLRFVGEGKGDCIAHGHEHGEADEYGATCERSPFTLGPIPYAAKFGRTLYMDEYMLLVDGVKPVTYSLADGRAFLPEGNVDGSPLRIHPNFRLVLSSNPLVRGASLPEPVASRCAGSTLTVETSASLLRDLGLDESIVCAWEALKNANHWTPQIREMRVADYWLTQSPEMAVAAMVPEHCPESQRKDVWSTVTGYLGGTVRDDGRLVVA